MTVRILVVQHDPLSPPGHVGDQVLCRGGSLDVRMPHLGGPLPADAGGHDGLLILGGPQAADDDVAGPHFPALIQLVAGFRAAGKPILGICLGAQLLARALGGRVSRLGFTEFGFVPLTRTEAGRTDPLVAEMGDAPTFMQYHEDTFTPPPDAVPLLAGAACPNQGFRVDRSIYALQCHLEATPGTARDWARLDGAKHCVAPGEDPVAVIETALATYGDWAKATTARVTDRWIDLVDAAR